MQNRYESLLEEIVTYGEENYLRDAKALRKLKAKLYVVCKGIAQSLRQFTHNDLAYRNCLELLGDDDETFDIALSENMSLGDFLAAESSGEWLNARRRSIRRDPRNALAPAGKYPKTVETLIHVRPYVDIDGRHCIEFSLNGIGVWDMFAESARELALRITEAASKEDDVKV